MILTRKILNFFKVAKVVCKDNNLTGIYYNGEKLIVASRLFQVRLTINETKLAEPLILPIQSLDYISAFREGSKVIFEKDSRVITVKCGRSKSSFAELDYELPKMAIKDASTSVKLKKCADILKNVATAADTKATKLIAQAIFIKNIDSNIVAYAVDGHRATFGVIKANTEEKINIRLHKSTLQLILGSGLLNDNFIISNDDNNRKVIIESEDIIIAAPIMDCGDFDVKSQFALAEQHGKNLNFHKVDMINALKRANIVSTARKIKLTITKEDISINLLDSVCEFYEEIPIISSSIEDLSIGINTDYLLTALSVMDEDEVKCKLTSPLMPIIIGSEKLKYMIVPLRLT